MSIEIIPIKYIFYGKKNKVKRDIIKCIISYLKWNVKYDSIQDHKMLKTNFNSLKYYDETETIVRSTKK